MNYEIHKIIYYISIYYNVVLKCYVVEFWFIINVKILFKIF